MYTERLARLIADATYESLSPEAVKAAKLLVLDCIGVTLAGSPEPPSRLVIEQVEELGGKPQSGVIGAGLKSSPLLAALANGTVAHVLDYDDVAWTWFGHASAVVLPAVLAVAHARKASGRQAILAHTVGLEAAARIGRACGDRAYLMGWHNTSTIGSVGAAVAVARVLGLDSDRTAIAIGIAASLASGLLKANVGTMTKPFHAGHGAQNGVLAALLAERGFTASKSALEGEFGFCRIFNGGGEAWPEKLVEGFGSPWDIVDPGLTLKPYPSCRSTHPGIDAALYLRQAHTPDPARIKEIEFRTSSSIPEILQHHRPQNALEGRFSLEYTVAIALLEGRVALKHFTDASWFADASVKALESKARYVHPPEWQKGMEAPQEVVLRMADGRELSKLVTVHDTRGDATNPMTEAELVAKYRDCAARVLAPQDVERSLEMIDGLERLDDMSPLMDIVTGKPD